MSTDLHALAADLTDMSVTLTDWANELTAADAGDMAAYLASLATDAGQLAARIIDKIAEAEAG